MREATRGLDAYRHHRRYFTRAARAAPLNRLLYVDMKTFLPCLNLDYTDRTSMAATLEVRVPFLNRELVELAARMPPDLKLRGLRRKYILKRAAEKLLPRAVVRRIVDANLSGREDYNLQVLQLLTLEMWHREFIDA
jgi:asparagine synthase (glutamine-hydrolysing)